MSVKFSIFISLFFGLFFIACQNKQKEGHTNYEETSEEVLEQYRPGYGEIMLQIQTRHIKLWYAGIGRHWELADFAIHEIEEALEKLHKYHPEKLETSHLNMMVPSIEGVEKMIKEKDESGFIIQFKEMTQVCNACHQISKHDYIQIKVPEYNPYSNQVFSDVEVSAKK